MTLNNEVSASRYRRGLGVQKVIKFNKRRGTHLVHPWGYLKVLIFLEEKSSKESCPDFASNIKQI